jgi:RNA polymerase sigma-70 factor (ECF subfamily)
MRVAWRRSRPGEEAELPVDAGDDVLVAAAQRGDVRAFARLYDRYQDRVLRFCYYRLGDWDEAGDAAQEVFTDAFAGLRRFRDRDDSFRTWLLRIAHNHVVDLHRHRARHPETDLDEAALLADPAPSPEAQAIVADDERRLRASLAHLPAGERAVVELRLVEMTGPEIARVLGISHDAARKAQSRAIARLQDLMTAGESRREVLNG